jgi:hypothetical protein
MKKKILFKTILPAGLMFYAISFIATKKNIPGDPCQATVFYYFEKDSIRRNYHQLAFFNDTLLIQADTLYPVNWNPVCDTICGIYKDSCKRTGPSILVTNHMDTARSTWDTRFGRTILFRKCP